MSNSTGIDVAVKMLTAIAALMKYGGVNSASGLTGQAQRMQVYSACTLLDMHKQVSVTSNGLRLLSCLPDLPIL